MTSPAAAAPNATSAAPDKKNIENIYPLTPMQQGLLFHTLLAPGAGAYVPQIALSLRGAVDGTRLRRAWEQVLGRHPVLRSAFHWTQREQPFQVVYRHLPLSWIEQDWSELDHATQAARLDALIAANRGHPFDLQRPPLMRLFWIRCGGDRHHLLWCYHHLILDGWSASLLLADVFRCAFAPATVPPPPRPYADFVAWLGRQDPAAATAFWQRHLHGVQVPTPLPILEPQAGNRGIATSMQHDKRERLMSADDTARLKAFAQRHQLTLNTLVQGALGLLLRRYGGTDDVVFGTTVAGRPTDLPGSTAMVGLFINTVPVRLRIDPALALTAWLAAVQRDRFAAADHEHVPLRELQALVPGGRPLFDCLLVFESYPIDGERLGHDGNVELESVAFDEWTHFPLTLLVTDGDRMRLTARYHGRRSTAAAIDGLLGHLQLLLRTMVLEPDTPLRALSLLTPAERALHGDWNRTAAPYPSDRTLPDLFEAQAARTPDHTALVFDDATMSYGALNARANALAHRLQASGIGPEGRVAVHIERSLTMMVALLAVVKAGAAYLPLDPGNPASRLQTMLDDAGATALLFDGTATLDALAVPPTVRRIDVAAAELSVPRTDDPMRSLHPDNSAYVIYTSGSTGRPKGVVNTHAGIVNRLHWMQQYLQLTPDDRVVQKTPLSFDVSVWELFWPLLEGATLVIAKPGGHLDAAYLAELIERQRITIAHFVPAMLAPFIEAPDVPARCAGLRHIVCSGEALTGALQQWVFGRMPHVQLHNLYGPTEAAVDVTAWRCEPPVDGTVAPTVPIGRPIQNIRIHILDADGDPTPVGVPGRLHIGGIGVARGYLNRPDLTAEKFVPDPFAGRDDRAAVLYDTGDLARRRPDGVIEYLGRYDDQVKLRGVRIEPGEIEAVLTRVAGIRQAIVALWNEPPAEPRLVAYVVPDGNADFGGEPGAAWQRALRQSLPDAMIPSQFIVIDSVPLTANGKPDRRALPRSTVTPSHEWIAPRSATESAIAAIWRDTLRVPAPGLHDNFFELGGHSLIATRIVTRVRTTLGVELPLAAVFEHPTLEAFAACIDASSNPASVADRGTRYREVEI